MSDAVEFVRPSHCDLRRWYRCSFRSMRRRFVSWNVCTNSANVPLESDIIFVCFDHRGGPLLSLDGLVLGIVSFGALPCGRGFDGYTRMSVHNDWILETICGLSAVPPEGCVVKPDWPKVSPWTNPCGQPNCASIFGAGVQQSKDMSLFWLWQFCFETCVPTFLSELLYFFNWECGGCTPTGR